MVQKQNVLRRIVCALLIVISMMGATMPALAAKNGDVLQVNGNLARVRSRPQSGSTVLAKIKKGTKVKYIKSENGWYLIQFPNGNRGYMYKSFLSPVINVKVGKLYRSRLKGKLPVHITPSKKSKAMFKIKNTTNVVLLKRKGNWGLVRIVKTGDVGYVNLKYLKAVK